MKKREYSPDWSDIIRPSILKRDAYQCRKCGIRHKSRVYTNSSGAYVICDSFMESWALANKKRVFTLFLAVSHIDQNKNNNDPSNLWSLCPRCHSNFDKEFKKVKRITFQNMVKSQPLALSPDALLAESKILHDLQKSIKLLTGVRVSIPDANSIFLLIIKHLNNEHN